MSSVITVSQPNYTVTVTGETTVTVDNTTTLTVATVGVAGPTGATGATGPAGPTDAGYQPGQPTSSSAVTVYVSATGNDTTGDGSVGSPYLTIRKAEQKVAEFPISSANVVNIGLGSFDFSGFHGINGISYVGTMVDGSTVTISSITLSGSDITMVVTGATATLNSLVGQYLKHSAGLYSCIRSNTATSAGNTTIVACLNNTNAAATLPIVTSTAIIQASGTFLTGGPSFRGGSITVQDCTPTGGASILWGTSPATANTWRRINFAQIGGVNSEGGVTNLETCYVGSLGGSLRGIGRVRQGTLYLKAGTILSGANAGANNFFVVCRGSTVDIAGPIGVDSLAGIRFEASRMVVSEFPGSWNVIGFASTCTKGFVVDLNASGNSAASYVYLPLMTGAITGNWCVEARRRAYVELTTGSSVTTSLGTNTASVDGVNQFPQGLDGTLIVNSAVDYRVKSSILYASPSGVDTNDGLTSATPITLTGALARCAKDWSGVNQIHLSSGTHTISTAAYLIPCAFTAGEPLTLVADDFTTTLSTRTSTTISGVVVTDSTLAMTTDQYKGYFLRFTSGANAASGIRYSIQSNTATAFTLTNVSLSPAPTAGDTFVIETTAVTIAHSGLRVEGGSLCAYGIKFSPASSAATFNISNNAQFHAECCETIGAGAIVTRTGAYFHAIGLKFASGLGPGLASIGSANQYSCWYHHGTGGFSVSTKGSFYGSIINVGGSASAIISFASNCTGNFLYLDTNQQLTISQVSMVQHTSTQIAKFTNSGNTAIFIDGNSYFEIRNAAFTTVVGDCVQLSGASRFKNTATGALTSSGVTNYGVNIQGGSNASVTTSSTLTGTAGDYKVGGLAAGTWGALPVSTASCDNGAASRGDWIERTA